MSRRLITFLVLLALGFAGLSGWLLTHYHTTLGILAFGGSVFCSTWPLFDRWQAAELRARALPPGRVTDRDLAAARDMREREEDAKSGLRRALRTNPRAEGEA